MRRREARPSDVIEGLCATCGGPLERRERDGWCAVCGVGWAYHSTGPKTATLTMVIEPDLVEVNTSLGRITMTAARLEARRQVGDGKQ